MLNLFNIIIPIDKLNKYYRDRLFELVDFDAVTAERKKLIGENRYEYIDKLVEDIEHNNKVYQDNGKTIGFIYGALDTILIVFIIKVVELLMS
jgi:hypothetical protein